MSTVDKEACEPIAGIVSPGRFWKLWRCEIRP